MLEKNIQKTPSAGALLVIALILSNVLNFVFNAFMGRVLSFEEFGFLTLISTFTYLINIVLNAITSTVNHRVAYLSTQEPNRIILFLKHMQSSGLSYSFISTIIWITAIWPLALFFNVSNPINLFLFSPFILFGIFNAIERGYLQGDTQFKTVSLLLLSEAFSKLLIALILVYFNLSQYVFLAIPFSTIFVFILILALRKINQTKLPNYSKSATEKFPQPFFYATLLAGISTYAFLTFDVLLAKHYLDPVAAGQYALLSLVGKMVFFFGSLFNSFIITYVSKAEGEQKSSISLFYKFFAGTAFFTLNSYILLGPLGFISVPILLGEKARVILPFLSNYTLAIALFTLTNTVTSYHLAKKHYFFPVLSILITLVMIISIVFFHSGIGEITTMVLISAFISFLLVMLSHLLYDQGRFILRYAIDLLDLFQTFPAHQTKAPNKKNILIFNWRDTKHKYAGGAEVYIHELAKRWVKQGHKVTLFCGNDGMSKRYEFIDGIQVIRRGGFYLVYLWAFLYYLKHFRGKYQVILDCQNGIPFFSPLYSKEKVLCLVFHVHQEVFRKYLPAPLALLAKHLEKSVMPFAYKNSKYITISQSTKTDLQSLGLLEHEIEIIYPGVDLTQLQPGNKSLDPLIVYIGRLKAYKSVDVLIKSFKTIIKSYPQARLIIAGSGEEEQKLKKLVKESNLDKQVEFKGKVTEKEKIQILQKAWVFVNPSYMEGWGITSIEANACGTVVVASDVPGLRDSINNTQTGILVPYGDVDSFSKSIIKLIKDHSLRRSIEKKAIDWANKFDWHRSAQKGLDLLK